MTMNIKRKRERKRKNMFIITDPYLVCKDHRLRYHSTPDYPKLSNFVDCDSDEPQEKEWSKYYKAVSNWVEEYSDDWEKSEYGKNFTKIVGINSSYLLNDFLQETYKDIYFMDIYLGHIHTLSGTLSIFNYKEVVKYNPAFTILMNENGMNECVIKLPDDFNINKDVKQITIE